MELRFRIIDKQDHDVLMPFKTIGTLDRVIKQFDKKLEGALIQFEGKEYSTDQAFSFLGLSVLIAADTKFR